MFVVGTVGAVCCCLVLVLSHVQVALLAGDGFISGESSFGPSREHGSTRGKDCLVRVCRCFETKKIKTNMFLTRGAEPEQTNKHSQLLILLLCLRLAATQTPSVHARLCFSSS